GRSELGAASARRNRGPARRRDGSPSPHRIRRRRHDLGEPTMNPLAIDIGGANLKAADGRGYASTAPFAVWRQPQLLAEELARLIAQAPACDSLAVTMTAELADCFATKAEGVREILAAVQRAAAGREIRVYQVDGQLA